MSVQPSALRFERASGMMKLDTWMQLDTGGKGGLSTKYMESEKDRTCIGVSLCLGSGDNAHLDTVHIRGHECRRLSLGSAPDR
eukprot:60156-Rhodomonas_salina.1